MEDKSKFLIIALVGVVGLSLYVNLQTFTAKKSTERERDSAVAEIDSLSKKIEENRRENQKLNEQVAALQGEVAKISTESEKIDREKDELQAEYDALAKERDELAQKLKDAPAAAQAAAAKEMQVPSGETQDAYWGRLLRSKVDLETQLEKARTDLKALQITNEQLQKEKSAFDLELNSLAHEKEDLKKEVSYHQQSIDSVATELVREKKASRQYQDSLKFVKSENAILKRQLKTLSDYKVSLEKQVAQLSEQKNTFERRFNEMGILLEDKVSGLSEMKERIETIRSGGEVEPPAGKQGIIELPPILVRPQGSIAGADMPLSGKVVAVDKDNNFVVVDLGEDSGIKTGNSLQVWRQGKQVGFLEVVQVRQKISACDIKQEFAPIITGDKVVK